MGDKSKIEWTEATWNPVRGCTKVSAGCRNCYAETFAERFRGVKGHPYERGFDVRLVPEALDLPLRWREPRRVFVNSMSDLFHPNVPDEYIDQVFAVMALADRHVFQVLTKRARRMVEYFTDDPLLRWALIEGAAQKIYSERTGEDPSLWLAVHGPLKNVWLGTSVENQAAADERIPHLLATPAAVRFLSCEPLLGPVDLTPYFRKLATSGAGWKLTGGLALEIADRVPDWVIVGGESGPKARPCDVAWVRSLVEQCRAAGVPAFVKQLGAHVEDRNDAGFTGEDSTSWPIHIFEDDRTEEDLSDTGYQGAPVRVHLRDRKGGDPEEWPVDLRVREWPEVHRGP